ARGQAGVQPRRGGRLDAGGGGLTVRLLSPQAICPGNNAACCHTQRSGAATPGGEVLMQDQPNHAAGDWTPDELCAITEAAEDLWTIAQTLPTDSVVRHSLEDWADRLEAKW